MSTETREASNIWRVIDILQWGEKYFSLNKFSNPRREIELFVQELLNCKRVDLYLRFDEILTKSQLSTLRNWVQRRRKHEPSQLITGKVGFYNTVLSISSGVLIPRPESEILVENIISSIPKNSEPSILDIGTGSGCIAIALAKEIPNIKVVGIDNSKQAIELASANAETLKITNVEFRLLDILKENINENFDIVVSNPPYIPKSEMNELMSEVKDFEPHSALTDFNDGLTFYRKFVEISEEILRPSGWFFIEVGLGKHPKLVFELFNQANFKNIELIKDYNGDERLLKAQLV